MIPAIFLLSLFCTNNSATRHLPSDHFRIKNFADNPLHHFCNFYKSVYIMLSDQKNNGNYSSRFLLLYNRCQFQKPLICGTLHYQLGHRNSSECNQMAFPERFYLFKPIIAGSEFHQSSTASGFINDKNSALSKPDLRPFWDDHASL